MSTTSRTMACPDLSHVQSLTLPTSTLVVAGALLLDAPVDPGPRSAASVRRSSEALDRTNLSDDGRLVPSFAALVDVVAWPELAAELVRQLAGAAPTRTLVWARAATPPWWGRRPEARSRSRRIPSGRSPSVLVEACCGARARPRPRASAARRRAPRCAARRRHPGVAAALDRAAGDRQPGRAAVAEPPHRRADHLAARDGLDGSRRASGRRARRPHCGALGTWEISGTAHPLDLRPTTRADVWRRVVEPLPPDGATGRSRPTDRPTDRRDSVTVAADPRRCASSCSPPATSATASGGPRTTCSDALARVDATCVDHRPAIGPVDHELRALVARWRAAGDATARFADELASRRRRLGDRRPPATGRCGRQRAVVARMRTDPDLAGRVDDLLDGDPTPDDIDARDRLAPEGRGRGRDRRRAPHVRRRRRAAARRVRCDGEPADPLGDAWQ